MISRPVSVVWQECSNQQKPAKQICTFLVVALHISAPNIAQTPEKGLRIEDSRLGDEHDSSGYSLLM